MDIAIAIYGAALATLIAIVQGVNALRRRVRIGVDTELTFASMNETERESAHGTPVLIDRNGHPGWQEVLLVLTVKNEGGVPIQVVAVVIESLSPGGQLSISQFAPNGLPHVLDPGTRIQIAIQKEPIDMLDNVTFLGVTDALGRRYSSKAAEVRTTVQQSWELPTRVQKFARRDNPSGPPVLAYQNREQEGAIKTTKSGKGLTALIRRPALLERTPSDPLDPSE
jgi:hypothetical protein